MGNMGGVGDYVLTVPATMNIELGGMYADVIIEGTRGEIKVNTVETPEEVARRIETASKIMGPDRITWVHPDCGFWMNKRSIADRKMEALVKGRDLFVGSSR